MSGADTGVRRAESGVIRQAGLLIFLGVLVSVGALSGVACGEAGDDDASNGLSGIHRFDTQDYHSLAFSPNEDGKVFFGHHGGIQVSSDRGLTWSVAVDQSGWDAMNLVFDPFSPETVYAAGHEIFYQSNDGGETWDEVSPDLPGLDVHALAASPTDEGRLYAFAVGHGVYVSDAGPTAWRPLWSEAPQSTLAILPLTNGTMLIAAGEAGLIRSEDRGETWSESGVGMDADAVFTVRGDPAGAMLYAGSSEGLYTSTDEGMTWLPTSLVGDILVVAVNPADSLELMAVDSRGELFHSRDGGATWIE